MAKNTSLRAIVKLLGISRSGNSEILWKFQSSGSVSDQTRWGHLRKILHEMRQKLIKIAKYQSKKAAKQGMDKYNLSNLVSVDTIKIIRQEYEQK